MSRMAVILTVAALVAVSLAVGWIASDWPHWCLSLGWCDGRGLL